MVIDGQGGGLGKQIVATLKATMPQEIITAVGTNSVATTAMLKAGADHAATGENAVLVGCRKVDVIIGPIGIVIADSLFGEITSNIAVAIGQSVAKKLLIPVNLCDNIVVGVSDLSVHKLIQGAVEEVRKMQL